MPAFCDRIIRQAILITAMIWGFAGAACNVPVRVARDDPAERLLVNLLLHPDTKPAAMTEPMVFPVFGRGGALPPPPPARKSTPRCWD